MFELRNSEAKRIFNQACAQKDVHFRATPVLERIYWNSDHYGLTGVPEFQMLSEVQKTQVLASLNEFNLHESLLVENLGFRFNAKMMTLSESTDERSLYAKFAFDESVHLNAILPFTEGHRAPDLSIQPMIQLLNSVIEDSSFYSTAFVVQVLLEGFGLAHYSSLAKNCLHPEFQEVLQKILKDEAFHHAGGKSVVQARTLSDVEWQALREILHSITKMFANWPHTLLRSFALAGYDDAKFQKRFLGNLKFNEKSKQRMEYVGRLLDGLEERFLREFCADGGLQILNADDIILSFRKSPINPVHSKRGLKYETLSLDS